MTLSQERLSLVLALGSLLLVSPPIANAQVTTADLVGTIKDSSGAVVPGVTVALTNEATGVSRSTTTGGAGTYIFTSLPIYWVRWLVVGVVLIAATMMLRSAAKNE